MKRSALRVAKFMGVLRGSRGSVTRLGTGISGMNVVAASWEGAIEVRLSLAEDGSHHVTIVVVPWHGTGSYREIYDGPLDKLQDGRARMLVNNNVPVLVEATPQL